MPNTSLNHFVYNQIKRNKGANVSVFVQHWKTLMNVSNLRAKFCFTRTEEKQFLKKGRNLKNWSRESIKNLLKQM